VVARKAMATAKYKETKVSLFFDLRNVITNNTANGRKMHQNAERLMLIDILSFSKFFQPMPIKPWHHEALYQRSK
jgi:hypothetical protein